MTLADVDKGFSICIPIFNRDVRPLVNELHRQACLLDIPFEIRLIDDCSQQFKEENASLLSLPFLHYTCLPQNIGRAAIRNLLAKEAIYASLIIMDCDALVTNEKFLHNYLKHQDKPIVMGGCQYPDTPPTQSTHLLRWVYGKAREECPAMLKNKMPYRSFSPFNFMIKKEILLSIQFDETLNDYGHEDTLLGWQLKKSGIPILHIDNPLIHDHHDESTLFLKKTEEATLNLWKIYTKMGNEKSAFAQEVKLLKCFTSLQKWHIASLIGRVLAMNKKIIVRNLLSTKPNLRMMDFYKLLCLYNASKQE